jgi:hypothetical protein
VLLDRRFLEISAKRLDVGRDVQRLDIGELPDAVVLAPGEEFSHGMQVGQPRVFVADGCGCLVLHPQLGEVKTDASLQVVAKNSFSPKDVINIKTSACRNWEAAD